MTLRAALEAIVNSGEIRTSDHPAAISALSSQYPHSIRHLRDTADAPYNCFMLALGLLESDRVYELLKKDADWYGLTGVKVGPEFVTRLIESDVLVRDDVGDIVVYFRDGLPVHAGLEAAGRVRSKWGIGNLWEHAIWEVPISYGNTEERFAIADHGALVAAFEAYASELVGAKGGYPD